VFSVAAPDVFRGLGNDLRIAARLAQERDSAGRTRCIDRQEEHLRTA
jgi:hypothetical protein